MSTMSTVRLNNGIKMPVVGLGTFKASSEEAEKSVHYALEQGYRHIDTARIYNNETGVGLALRTNPLPRDELFITTKLWNDDHHNVVPAFEASLRRLGLDYVDQYLIHWPVSQRNESWKVLEELYKKGMCKSIGVSNFTIKHLTTLLEQCDIVPAVNQVEFSPFLFQKELLDFCKEKKIQLVAHSPLSRASNLTSPVLQDIATTHKKTAAQVMLRWALQHDTVVIPKSTHMDRIAQNIDLFDFVLNEKEMERLNALHDDTRHCPDPEELP